MDCNEEARLISGQDCRELREALRRIERLIDSAEDRSATVSAAGGHYGGEEATVTSDQDYRDLREAVLHVERLVYEAELRSERRAWQAVLMLCVGGLLGILGVVAGFLIYERVDRPQSKPTIEYVTSRPEPRGIVQGKVWPDENGDGLQEGELPAVGVTVTLRDAFGRDVSGSPTVTDGNGAYYFGGLGDGKYTLVVQLPEGNLGPAEETVVIAGQNAVQFDVPYTPGP